MSNLVPTNQYRVLYKCPNCPFRTDGKAIELQPGILDSIKAMLLKDDSSSFTCHKTAYNLDLDMQPTKPQKPKMCAGAFEFLIENNKPNQMMRMAFIMGIEEYPRKNETVDEETKVIDCADNQKMFSPWKIES